MLILGGSRRRLTIKPVTTLWFPASGLTCPNSPWLSPIFALSYLCGRHLITVSRKYKAPSGFKFIICFVSYHPSLLPPPPPRLPFHQRTHIHVALVVFPLGCMFCHVKELFQRIPEDPTSSAETISPRNFSKDLLSPPPHHPKTSCFTELFPASVAAKFHNFPNKSLLQL